MNFVVFIITVVGLYGFVTKLSAAGASLELYSERNYTCPEKFRKDQKRSDVVHAVNCFFLAFYAAVLLFYGITFLFSASFALSPKFLLMIAIFSIFHTVVNKVVISKLGLGDKMSEIMEQWKSQKKITDTNDDEVRLYRMIKESVVNERYNIFYMILLFLMYFIVMA